MLFLHTSSLIIKFAYLTKYKQLPAYFFHPIHRPSNPMLIYKNVNHRIDNRMVQDKLIA
jgi:hypothetical protein